MKYKFLTKEDRSTLKAARKVLSKVTKKLAGLETVRAECDEVEPVNRDAANGKKWKAATLELYNLIDEIDAAKLKIQQYGNKYRVWLDLPQPGERPRDWIV